MTAAGALLHAGITSLPVDLFRVAEHFSVKVVDYAACADIYDITAEELYRTVSTQGFSFMDDGQFICAINAAACGKMRKRFTLAHELSHILLSHVGGFGERPSEKVAAQQEKAADRFAAELLAPLSVLHYCGVSSAQEVARLCGISMEAAHYRFEELSRLRRRHAAILRSAADSGDTAEMRSAFFSGSDEWELFRQLLPFIGGYLTERSYHDGYADYLKRKSSSRMLTE